MALRRFILVWLAISMAFLHLGDFDLRAGILEPDEVSLRGTVPPDRLLKEIESRRSRVLFFTALKEEAEKLGLRLWLLGGSASSFAHYVRWDLLREGGDSEFRSSKFDYDFVQIFRFDQDFDLVIDGDSAKALELEGALKSRFPGQRFDIFCLNSQVNHRPAILSSDFLDQSSDSYSFGLLEMTSHKGESVVRSANQWQEKEQTPFLKDIAEGGITYLRNPKHRLTQRYRAGLNPEILSLFRYLIKVVSYGLKIKSEDLKELKSIARNQSISKLIPDGSPYLINWMNHHATKLYTRSIDLLRSRDLFLELMSGAKWLDNRFPELAKWYSRDPLNINLDKGGIWKLAQSVTHDARDFLNYERITASPTHRPNVFISRKNTPGELANYGNGFYVGTGSTGYWGTPHVVLLRAVGNIGIHKVNTGIFLLNDGVHLRLRDISDTDYRNTYFTLGSSSTPGGAVRRLSRSFRMGLYPKVVITLASILLVSVIFPDVITIGERFGVRQSIFGKKIPVEEMGIPEAERIRIKAFLRNEFIPREVDRSEMVDRLDSLFNYPSLIGDQELLELVFEREIDGLVKMDTTLKSRLQHIFIGYLERFSQKTFSRHFLEDVLVKKDWHNIEALDSSGKRRFLKVFHDIKVHDLDFIQRFDPTLKELKKFSEFAPSPDVVMNYFRYAVTRVENKADLMSEALYYRSQMDDMKWASIIIEALSRPPFIDSFGPSDFRVLAHGVRDPKTWMVFHELAVKSSKTTKDLVDALRAYPKYPSRFSEYQKLHSDYLKSIVLSHPVASSLLWSDIVNLSGKIRDPDTLLAFHAHFFAKAKSWQDIVEVSKPIREDQTIEASYYHRLEAMIIEELKSARGRFDIKISDLRDMGSRMTNIESLMAIHSLALDLAKDDTEKRLALTPMKKQWFRQSEYEERLKLMTIYTGISIDQIDFSSLRASKEPMTVDRLSSAIDFNRLKLRNILELLRLPKIQENIDLSEFVFRKAVEFASQNPSVSDSMLLLEAAQGLRPSRPFTRWMASQLANDRPWIVAEQLNPEQKKRVIEVLRIWSTVDAAYIKFFAPSYEDLEACAAVVRDEANILEYHRIALSLARDPESFVKAGTPFAKLHPKLDWDVNKLGALIVDFLGSSQRVYRLSPERIRQIINFNDPKVLIALHREAMKLAVGLDEKLETIKPYRSRFSNQTAYFLEIENWIKSDLARDPDLKDITLDQMKVLALSCADPGVLSALNVLLLKNAETEAEKLTALKPLRQDLKAQIAYEERLAQLKENELKGENSIPSLNSPPDNCCYQLEQLQ